MPLNDYNIDSEQFWVANIRAGDERAFEILFRKFYAPLTRFAWRYVNSKAVAEELVQESFTNIWERRNEWYITGSLRSYLYKTVKNQCINHLHREKIIRRFDTEWVHEQQTLAVDYSEEPRDRKIREAISKAVEELPGRSKMIYKLYRHDGLTYTEIADVMDISVRTVESQMSRTLQILRKKLADRLPAIVTKMLAG